MGRQALPTVDEQEEVYRQVAAALGGRPSSSAPSTWARTNPPALPRRREAAFLGVRGIRIGLEHPQLLVDQLRAVLRVAAAFPLRVMFPMIASLDELYAQKELLGDAAGLEACPLPEGFQVGVMIEVPSAALTADRLAAEADFFSVGTNDLSQYTLAADRRNPSVAGLADALHPAVLELIAAVTTAAAAYERWVGVCGEVAGDTAAVPLLVGLGVTELSAAPRSLPAVKQAVRALELERTRSSPTGPAECRMPLQCESWSPARARLCPALPRKLTPSARCIRALSPC